MMYQSLESIRKETVDLSYIIGQLTDKLIGQTILGRQGKIYTEAK